MSHYIFLPTKVVVGIVINEKGQLLVSKRPIHSLSGGFWEFPGGKVEKGESHFDALVRELKEEVNLEVISAVSFLRFDHEGVHRPVDLDIWHVTKFQGEAFGVEGQEIQWLFLEELADIGMLPACKKILIELKLVFSQL